MIPHKKRLKNLPLIVLLLDFLATSGQQFNFKTTELPRFRNGKAIVNLDNSKRIIFGGWLRNDSITGIYNSDDTGSSYKIMKDELGGMFNTAVKIDPDWIYAAGRSGNFSKSSDLGNNWQINRLAGFENVEFTHVFFLNKDLGWLSGYNEYNRKTYLLQTTDGGSNWVKLLDSSLFKPKFIYATNEQQLVMAGEKGLMMFYSDNGKNWESLANDSSNKNKNFNSITKINDVHFLIAGGEISGTDTSQIIWLLDIKSKKLSTVYKSKGPRLNSIVFLAGQTYTVGDKGVFYYSSDTAKNLIQINLPNQSTDKRDLNQIQLIHPGKGLICGNQGRMIDFFNLDYQKPSISLDAVNLTKELETKISYSINPKGIKTNAYLKITHNNTVDSIILGDFNGFDSKVFKIFRKFSPGFYSFQIIGKYTDQIEKSNIIEAHLDFDRTLNFDFESWDTISSDFIQNWKTIGNIKRINLNHLSSIYIQASGQEDPGGIYLATANDDSLRGGIPINSTFDTLFLRCKYDIEVGDSAYTTIRFKNNQGIEIFRQEFRWTGTVSQDTTLTFNLNLPSTLEKADTLIFAILSTNYFGNHVDTNSYMILDSIWVNNSVNPFPNAGFFNWDNSSIYSLKNWQNYLGGSITETKIQPSIGFHSQSTAVEMKLNKDYYNGMLNYGQSQKTMGSMKPTLTLDRKPNSLSGYYKFSPQSLQDSFFIDVYLFKDTQIQGYSRKSITLKSENWESFNLPISYFQNSEINGAHIAFTLKGSSTNKSPEIIIDDLNFDILLDSNFRATISKVKKQPIFSLFPNPASDQISITSIQGVAVQQLHIYNINGQLVKKIIVTDLQNLNKSIDLQKFDLNCSDLLPGIYFFQILHSSGIQTIKLQIN